MDRLEFQHESTTSAILHYLKKRGEADAKTIANFCGLTTMAVSRHLLKLGSTGLIQSRWERRPMGRPAALYSLTEKGDGQFPKDYADLANEALLGLSPSAVQQLFRRRRRAIESRCRARRQGKDLAMQVEELAVLLAEYGYMSEVQAPGPDEFVVKLCNCPIREVARRFPVACDEELCLVRNVVGGKVTRESHLLAGDYHCSYRICGGAARRQERVPVPSTATTRGRRKGP